MSALFVASVGNPAPYERTLHSAGHILLKALGTSLNAPQLTRNPSLRDGLTTEANLRDAENTRVTLWQSPTYMNESGPAMVGAFKTWLKQQDLPAPALLPAPHSAKDLKGDKLDGIQNVAGLYRPRLRLVLLHDELEATPARLTMRYGGAERSSRGHRGVRSVVQSLIADNFLDPPEDKSQLSASTKKKLKKTKREERAAAEAAEREAKLGLKSSGQQPEIEDPDAPDTPEQEKLRRSFESPVLTRLQIGIGRPAERDANAVAKYVLNGMYGSHYVRTCAHGDTVARLLQEILMTKVSEVKFQ